MIALTRRPRGVPSTLWEEAGQKASLWPLLCGSEDAKGALAFGCSTLRREEGGELRSSGLSFITSWI